MTESISKYRVSYLERTEYVEYFEKDLTHVYSVQECDVYALNAVDAIAYAAKAFGAKRDGEWKVRSLNICPDTAKFVGASSGTSTLSNVFRNTL